MYVIQRITMVIETEVRAIILDINKCIYSNLKTKNMYHVTILHHVKLLDIYEVFLNDNIPL